MSHKGNVSVNLDVAKRLDITCRKGDTFSLVIAATDASGVAIDFGGFVDMKMQVRPTDEDVATPVIEFTYPTDFETPELGSLVISKDSTFMETVESGIYVYDIQLTDATSKTVTWFYGLFKINDDISF